MVKTASFKRLILRAVLRQVSPMVIRLVSVSDHMPLPEFHDVFRTILGWNGDLGYIIRTIELTGAAFFAAPRWSERLDHLSQGGVPHLA